MLAGCAAPEPEDVPVGAIGLIHRDESRPNVVVQYEGEPVRRQIEVTDAQILEGDVPSLACNLVSLVRFPVVVEYRVEWSSARDPIVESSLEGWKREVIAPGGFQPLVIEGYSKTGSKALLRVRVPDIVELWQPPAGASRMTPKVDKSDRDRILGESSGF